MQIGVNTRGINPFMAKTKRAQQMLKTAPQEYVRKRVFAVYKFVIDATPQYSGALVDSWSLRTNLISPGTSAKVPGDWTDIDPVDTPGEFEANKKRNDDIVAEAAVIVRENMRKSFAAQVLGAASGERRDRLLALTGNKLPV